eukprot:877785_1
MGKYPSNQRNGVTSNLLDDGEVTRLRKAHGKIYDKRCEIHGKICKENCSNQKEDKDKITTVVDKIWLSHCIRKWMRSLLNHARFMAQNSDTFIRNLNCK